MSQGTKNVNGCRGSHYLYIEKESSMKHVRKRSTAKQLETCGVWLDTAKLKKHKVQTLLSKPTPKVTNLLSERSSNSYISVNFTQTRVSQPCTKQSTISSFFSIQPTGEKNDENLVACSCVSNKRYKGKGSGSLAASSMKSSGAAELEHAQAPTFSPPEGNTQAYSQPLVQNTQCLNISLLKRTLPQAVSRNKNECTAIARTPAGDTEDSPSINFTQDSEGNRVLDHMDAADSVNGRVSVANGKVSRKRESHWIGEDEGHLCSKRETRVGLKPDHLMKQGRKRCKNLSPGGISFTDFSEVENVSPVPKGNEGQQTNSPVPKGQKAKAEPLRACQDFPGSWTRNCYNMAGSAEEQGDSKNSPATKLFTQDSEGYRVISHQHFYENVSSLQKKYPQDTPNSVHKGTTPMSGGCFSVYSSEAWDRTLVAFNSDEPQSCYDSLFTEDSEGNRIIKH